MQFGTVRIPAAVGSQRAGTKTRTVLSYVSCSPAVCLRMKDSLVHFNSFVTVNSRLSMSSGPIVHAVLSAFAASGRSHLSLVRR